MMAICPAGPPKLINPSWIQNRKASAKLGKAIEGSDCMVERSCDPINQPLEDFSSSSSSSADPP
jgi:hypothetical protein